MRNRPSWVGLALATTLMTGLAGCDDDPTTPELTAPAAPSVTQADGAVTVSWAPVATAESYTVQRDQIGDAAGFTDIAAGITATQHQDDTVAEGTTYQYRVVAVRDNDRAVGDPAEIAIGARRADLTGAITGTRTLSADTLYTMKGQVVVEDGGTLVIPAGTTIQADPNIRPTYLLVRTGGRIEAEGTATDPIVFTSGKPEGERARGDWGGVVLAGRSNCNFPAPCQVEGAGATYGGDAQDDDSGVLSYVRIEYAGFEVSPGNELNGLTLAGVGSATQIDHVQVHYGSDDGIEWFGGTVNVKYALVTGADDDSFDYSSGWTGKGQFWIAQQSENAGDKGFEVDGNETVFTATPLTDPQVYNVTMVGRGTGASSSNDAIQLRRGVRGSVRNAILLGWGGAALDVDDSATAVHCSDTSPLIDDVIWFSAAAQYDEDDDTFEATCAGSDWRNLDPQLGAPADRAAPNFVPAAGSPALTGAATPPTDGFFDAVDYLGAVAPTGTPWYQGWTTVATN